LIQAKAPADWGSDETDSPADLKFFTTPDNSGTPLERFKLGSDGSANFFGQYFRIDAGGADMAIACNTDTMNFLADTNNNGGSANLFTWESGHATIGSGTRRMTIDSNGNLTFNCGQTYLDSPSHAFLVANSSATTTASWVVHKMAGTDKWYSGVEGSVGGQYRIYDAADASVAVHVATTGNSWVADSDERMKKDITSMENRLDDLLKIKVRRFKWKHNDKVDFGFVAQELETCVPDAVEVGSDEVYSKEEVEDNPTAVEGALKNPYGVSREQLIPMMVKSIQELSAKVTALENA
jgi:hypothetical protein